MRSEYFLLCCAQAVVLVAPFNCKSYGRSRRGERREGVLCLTYLQAYPLSIAAMSRCDLKHKPPKLWVCPTVT